MTFLVGAPMNKKLWERRIEGYRSGIPIPKSMISTIIRILRSDVVEDLNTLNDYTDGRLIYDVNLPMLTSLDWAITSTQTDQGLEWLAREYIANSLPDDCKAILRGFLRFTLSGFRVRREPFRFYPEVSPVYRVHASSGAFFDYWATPGCRAANVSAMRYVGHSQAPAIP